MAAPGIRISALRSKTDATIFIGTDLRLRARCERQSYECPKDCCSHCHPSKLSYSLGLPSLPLSVSFAQWPQTLNSFGRSLAMTVQKSFLKEFSHWRTFWKIR